MSDQVSSSVIRTRVLCRCRQCRAIALAVRNGRQQIDAGKALERCGHRQQFRLGKRIGGLAAKRKPSDAGRLRGMGDHDDAVGHDGVIGRIGAIPFQHGEFGKMQIAAFAVAKHPRKLENLLLRPAASNFLQANSGEVRK